MARKLALITGASAGIGAAFARAYAARGYDLALTARRRERLEALAGELKSAHGAQCLVLPADLADPKAPAALIEAIAAAGRPASVVVNNAGYGLPGTFATTTWQDQAAFIQVMVTAVAELSHRTLPAMRAAKFGRIINVASLAGLLPGSAGHTLYAASKAFLIRMSQSLAAEAGDGVQVTALCPGFTYSEFHDANGTREAVSKMPRALWQDAETVVDGAIAANEAGEAVFVPGSVNKSLAWLGRALPPKLTMRIVAGQSSRFRRME
jgi:uncharacterized protein